MTNRNVPLHQVQMQILLKAMLNPNAKFRDLRIKDMPTDHFTYHLNKLVSDGFLDKKNKIYSLTDEGKKFVNTMNSEHANQEIFGKRGVLLRAIRINNKSEVEYLVYKRTKQPFYGFFGFHTGKIRFGETPLQTAFREFYEETNLQIVDYEFVGIYHQIGYSEKGELLRDIYLYHFNIYSFEGKLLKENKEDGVVNMWMTADQFKNVKTYPGFWDKSKLNWVHMPRQYQRYLKLEKNKKWENNTIDSSTNIYYEDSIKVINEW